MNHSFDIVILTSILTNKEFRDAVIHHLKPDFFSSVPSKAIFKDIDEFNTKYGVMPNLDALEHIINSRKGNAYSNKADVDQLGRIKEYIKSGENKHDFRWLMDETEKFCKHNAVLNALEKSADLVDKNDGKVNLDVIPDLLKEAVNISFDTTVGHDYFEDASSRWQYLTQKVEKMPTDLSCINYITRGGFSKSELVCIAGGTGVGKTWSLADHSCAFLRKGKNVLYVSLEIGENEFAARVDANMCNIRTDEIEKMSEPVFVDMVKKARTKCGTGKLFIKRYPSTLCTTKTLDSLMQELYHKQGFKPDVVVVDYLGIMGSYRLKSQESSYQYLKSVSEELRSFAVSHNVLVLTACQLNRGGMDSAQPSSKDISDSIGVMFTFDLAYVVVRTNELDMAGQMKVIQLKNRNMDTAKLPEFVIGASRDYQRFYDAQMPPVEGYGNRTSTPPVPVKPLTSNKKLQTAKWSF